MRINLKYYIACLGSIIIVSVLLFDSLLMPLYVRHGRGSYMVNVEGKQLEYALDILSSEGHRGLVSDTLFSSAFNPGIVIDQYPSTNMKVKEGRTVRLTIANAERSVMVPDLIGRSERSAELDISQVGLEIDTVYKEYNSDVPAGNVTWQYPKGGDMLSRGMGIHLTISLGVPPNFFQAPNIFGLSKKKAIVEIEKSGFSLGKVYYRQNEDLIPYTVLDQSLKPGTVLEKSVAIDLTISVLDMQDIFNNIVD
ncbi:PASTA domain-containing protein [Candidatus Marinimicrobia bacterium]|nr:PASTA domain-containing protein [Candidatus Neomarinimicrobiota bacterium]